MENMDMAPYLMAGGRWGYRMGDAQLYDSMLRDGLNDAFSGEHSGWHTEDLVAKHGVTREAQDAWALRSQQRFGAAQAAGRFSAEIVPVEVKGRKGPEPFAKDEHNRPDTTAESLAKLRPVLDNTITAGNAPGSTAPLRDDCRGTGWAEKNGPNRWRASRPTASPPSSPASSVSAVPPCARRWNAGWKIGDVNRVEINERSAIAVPAREMGFAADVVNVGGLSRTSSDRVGAVRRPHSAFDEARRLKRGIVTLCIGGGQGIALALETL
jgi:acetyl-CoA C-acetyltransferase